MGWARGRERTIEGGSHGAKKHKRSCTFDTFDGAGGAGPSATASTKCSWKFTGEIKPVLFVSDVEKSAPFDRDVLGFTFKGFANSAGQPYDAEMAAAGVKFGLHEPTSTGQETDIGQERLYFRVEDLQAHRSRVLAWGGVPGRTRWPVHLLNGDVHRPRSRRK